MYVGTGIFLLVVGAILTWGVSDRLSGVNLPVIGYICMAGGALAILMSLVTSSRRRGGYTATRSTRVDPVSGSRVDEVDVDPS